MRKSLNVLWRSLLIALVYTGATTLIGGLVMRPAGILPAPANPILLLATTFISGILISATLGPMASQVYASRRRSVAIWTTLVFLNIGSVVLEGYFFSPGLLPPAIIPRILVLYALSALTTALSIAFLFPATRPAPGSAWQVKRSPQAWMARFFLSAAAYLLFYYGFGAINYALVTGPYYETHPALAVPERSTLLMVESIRAVIMISSVLPLILALRTSRRALAVRCGLALFVIGGILPLLMQAGSLPPAVLVASGVEIFFQNFLTGVAAALLLGGCTPSPALLHPVPTVALEDHS